MNCFDTHAHYTDKRFDADRAELLALLPSSGVPLVVVPGVDLPSSYEGVRLALDHPHVWAAVGIHPHEASPNRALAVMTPSASDDDSFRAKPEDLAKGIDDLLSRDKTGKIIAVGEVGLDYHYDFSPRDVQREVFRLQLELARTKNLPVIVHDREAHADTLDMVRAFPGIRGVFHCYSGSLEMAKTLVRLGWHVSFTGVLTFRGARKLLEVAAWLPDDHILIETDAPYLTPEPHRGKRNDSRFVHLVAQALAHARGVTPEEMAARTMENGKKLFGIQ